MLLSLLLAAAVARAAPTLVYAPMAQQPPVARVGDEFVFDLLPSTFNSTSSMIYTTSTLPAWLTFDPTFLIYSGTPSASDAGEVAVTLTATDASGSTAAAWTCLVSSSASPAVHESFTTQIGDPSVRAFASATAMPGDTGVIVPPYWSFSLGWSSSTFRQAYTGGNGHLYWAAHVRDMAGLPDWLSFSNSTFTFNGVAPADGSYTVVVTGTDYWGYSAAVTSFVIEVGQGEPLEMTGNWSTVQGVAGSDISYVVDATAYQIGGQAAVASELALDVMTTYFDWLSFDASTNTLSGTVPADFKNGTVVPLAIPVRASTTNTSDTFTLTSWLSMSIAPYAFTNSNLSANATAEQEFVFDLAPYVNALATVTATVSPEGAASWLTFYPANLSLVGMPPSNANATVEVVFAAVLAGATSIAELDITLSGTTTNATSSTSGSAPVPEGTVVSHGLSTSAKIALGVVFGLLGLVLLALLLFFCCHRRRKRAEREESIVETGAKDDASFVAGSPVPHDPFGRKPLAVMYNPLPNFSGLYTRTSTDAKSLHPISAAASPRAASFETGTTAAVLASPGKPTRFDGLKGIFGWAHKDVDDDGGAAAANVLAKPRLSSEGSFAGEGDVIGVTEGIDMEGSQDGSSFTRSLASSTDSRASWESRATFRWSSADGSHDASHYSSQPSDHYQHHRLSAAPSIPRPRPNFTPRYPRTRSPTELARLASEPSLDHSSFSEFRNSRVLARDRSSFAASGSEPSLGTASTSFPLGPAGLDRFASSGAFPSVRSIDEGDGDAVSSVEEPAVVRLAERQSFETRRPTTAERPTPRLRPSRERVSTIKLAPAGQRSASHMALTYGDEHDDSHGDDGDDDRSADEGVFDDADEARRSTYAPSEVNGLGYPASAIYFGDGADASAATSQRASLEVDGGARGSTIRVVPTADAALSPPLPTVGNFMRHRRTGTNDSVGRAPRRAGAAGAAGGDGRVVACVNETFSIHPSLNPPPTVSLSAATWSSAPPSTYRATLDNGAALPAWLHFDARELELWGVPHVHDAGNSISVRVVEKMPSQNRRSDPLAFGYQPPQEREVGRVVIDVVDRLRSPQFALDDGSHAV
ncbi:polarity establishment/cellular polarization [Cryptotrichosporon argae]